MKKLAALLLALSFAPAVALAAPHKPLTHDDLTAAQTMVFDAYGKMKYAQVEKQVIGKLGPAQKTAANLKSWFAKDGAQCYEFTLTNSSGNAAVTLGAGTENAKTGCK